MQSIDLPKGWMWKKVFEIMDTASGGTPLRSHLEYFGGHIPWVKSGELNDGIISTVEENITDLGLKNSNAKLFPKNTVIVALYGATIGKTGILDFDATTNQAICALLPKIKNINPKYILYWFISQRQYLISKGAGGAQPNISQGIIRSLDFPIPPLPEQERIVAKIEELFTQLDAGTSALKRVRAGLKRYKASVLKAAVEGKLIQQNSADEPAIDLLNRLGKKPLEINNLPELPQGWCWNNLKNITTIIRDVDHKMPKEVSSEIPYISTRNFFGEDEIDFEGAKHISEEDYKFLSRKIKPEKGDILLSRYGTIGEIRRIKTDMRFQVSYSIAIIKPLPIEELANYLAVFLRSNLGQEQMRKNIRASSQPDLGLGSIREFLIPIPPLAEQLRIFAETERFNSIIQELDNVITASLARTTNLRQSILKKAFEGNLT